MFFALLRAAWMMKGALLPASICVQFRAGAISSWRQGNNYNRCQGQKQSKVRPVNGLAHGLSAQLAQRALGRASRRFA